jgi:hypothetical protein
MAELDVVVAGLNEVIDFLFRQTILVKSVTYSAWQKPEFDDTDRVMKETPDPRTVDAIDVGSVIAHFGEGQLPFGSVRVDLIFRASDLSAEPTTRDKVTIDGKARQVTGMVPYLNIAYGVTLEGTN